MRGLLDNVDLLCLPPVAQQVKHSFDSEMTLPAPAVRLQSWLTCWTLPLSRRTQGSDILFVDVRAEGRVLLPTYVSLMPSLPLPSYQPIAQPVLCKPAFGVAEATS